MTYSSMPPRTKPMPRGKGLSQGKRGKKKLLERGTGQVNIPEEVFMKMVQESDR